MLSLVTQTEDEGVWMVLKWANRECLNPLYRPFQPLVGKLLVVLGKKTQPMTISCSTICRTATIAYIAQKHSLGHEREQSDYIIIICDCMLLTM